MNDESDYDASFYRFAMGSCGVPALAQPRRGLKHASPRTRTSLTQHFKLKHRAGRELALRVIKRLLDDRHETRDR